MPKPRIPEKPVHGYVLKFWTTNFSDEAVERTWTYYLDPTPCEEVLGEGHENGTPFEDAWYTGGGRFTGWALPDPKSRGYHDMWADAFPTRLEALRHFRTCLQNRLQIEQEALKKTEARLALVEKEIAAS